MEWSDKIICQLRALWAEGHSTAEIGRRLGVTKNAIVGKAHRLDLTARPSPIRRDPNAPASVRRVVVRRVEGPTLPPLPSAVAEAEPFQTVDDAFSTPITPPERTGPERTGPERTGPEFGIPEPLRPAPVRSETLRPEPLWQEPLAPVPMPPAPLSPGLLASGTRASEIRASAPRASETMSSSVSRAPVILAPPIVIRPAIVLAPPTLSRPAVAAVRPTFALAPRPVPSAPRPVPSAPRFFGRVVTCCWPLGEPGTREFQFCDVPSEPGRPYCEEHVKVAYVRIRERREDAA